MELIIIIIDNITTLNIELNFNKITEYRKNEKRKGDYKSKSVAFFLE